LTRAIIEAARIEPGMRVLDVACGTGEPGISVATMLRGSGEVVGIDISHEPLKIAAERATERGLMNVTFQQADAHVLPFADESFHRITSRLGVMFFAEPPRALREMWRVLKPGGSATLLAWGPMSQPYFETTIGTVLKHMPGSSLPEGSEKIFSFGESGSLASAMRNARFSRTEERFVTLPFSWPGTPEEVWEYFQSVAVPFAALLQSIPAVGRAEIDRKVLAEIGRYYDGKAVNLTATVNITTAVK
jgi:ubiquinone/menaquinone biosynthesis C-methylase UbiE